MMGIVVEAKEIIETGKMPEEISNELLLAVLLADRIDDATAKEINRHGDLISDGKTRIFEQKVG